MRGKGEDAETGRQCGVRFCKKLGADPCHREVLDSGEKGGGAGGRGGGRKDGGRTTPLV